MASANHSITDFINNFKGGTRLNRFEVKGGIGKGRSSSDTTPFHIRTASLPGAAVGPIAINYRGRSVAYSGDRAYKPWAITVIDDHSGVAGGTENLYKKFHDWQNDLNSHATNTVNFASLSPGQQITNSLASLWAPSWQVIQYGINCDDALPGRTFTLYNVWPIEVGEIALDMSQDNVLASFAVSLAFSHYTYDGVDTNTNNNT